MVRGMHGILAGWKWHFMPKNMAVFEFLRPSRPCAGWDGSPGPGGMRPRRPWARGIQARQFLLDHLQSLSYESRKDGADARRRRFCRGPRSAQSRPAGRSRARISRAAAKRAAACGRLEDARHSGPRPGPGARVDRFSGGRPALGRARGQALFSSGSKLSGGRRRRRGDPLAAPQPDARRNRAAAAPGIGAIVAGPLGAPCRD